MKKVMRSGLVWLWVAVLTIIADVYSKKWALQHLIPGKPLHLLPFFDLHLAYNTGAAFSFLHAASGWQNAFFLGFAILVSLFIIIWLSRLSLREAGMSIALCLILGGALGNAWDRMQYHHVIDFLSFHAGGWYFAIFNVADSAICIGVLIVLLYWMLRPQ